MEGVIAVLPRPLGYSAFWVSLIKMRKPQNVGFMFMEGSRVDFQRNQIIEAMLSTDAKWLLFLDDDHMVPPVALERLLSLKLPVVGAQYIVRIAPYHTAASIKDGDVYRTMSPEEAAPHGPVETHVLGMGCTLIRREVLEAVGPDPFQYGWREGRKVGEDVAFSEAVYRAGFKMYTDTDLALPHIAPRGVTLIDGRVQFLDGTEPLVN